MANNIKGITVEIGGNTGPLTTALKNVNKTAGDLQSELKEVNKQLKFDPKNTELLKQKQDLLRQSTETLKEKQAALKEAVKQAHEAFEKGDLGADKVRAVEREYAKVNTQLKNTQKELKTADQATGTFASSVKAKFSGIKDKIKETFTAENIKAGLGAIGVAAAGVLKSSIDKAAAAEKVTANLEQTLKSTGGAAGMTTESLSKLTTQMVATSTYSGSTVKEGEAMMLTFTQIGKDVFPQATQAMLDYATKMKVEPKDAAMTLGKALNDPANGLSKLTRAGVTFTEEQKKQIKAMQAAGDTAGAQKLMLDELNKEFGGQAAAAADTYEGKQQQLKNTLNSVQATIGGAILPVLQQLMTAIMPVVQKIAEFVSEHPKLTAGILAAVAAIGLLVGGMSLVNTVMGIFGTVSLAALGPVLLVIAAVAAVAAAAFLIVKNWSKIKDFFKGLWEDIKGVFSGVGDWFKDKFEKAKEGVQTAWSGVKGFFGGVWDGIKGSFTDSDGFFHRTFTKGKELATKAWSGYVGTYVTIWNGIKSVFGPVGSWFSEKFSSAKNTVVTIWNAAPQIFSGIASRVGGAFSGVGGKIKAGFASGISYIKALPGEALQWGRDIVNGIANGIRAAAGAVKNAVTKVATDIRKFLHFSKPDEGPLADFDTYMPDMMSLMADGIRRNTAKVTEAVHGMASSVSERARSALGAVTVGTPALQAVTQTVMPAEVIHRHTGAITVRGENTHGEVTQVVDLVIDRLREEARV